MSEKDVVLENQGKLTELQLDQAEEIEEHLVKAQSLIDVISNSIEAKNAENTLDLASELNSMVSVYDELEHAIGDIDEIIDALKGILNIDEKDD